MVKIIEASAVISARAGDMSGIDQMAAKLLNASKMGDKVKTALSGAGTDLGKRVDEISGKLRSIDNFRNMSRGLDDASVAMRRAQQEAARLKSAMEAAGSPTKAMQGEYARAASAVQRATDAFRAQGAAVREARSALSASGVPVNQIARQQGALTTALNQTTAAMQRQAAASRQLHANPPPRPGPGTPVVPVSPAGSPRPGPGPIVEIGATAGVVGAVTGAARAGMDVDSERSQARQAGWTEAEIKRAEDRANALSTRYGISPGSALNIVREARPTFGGDLDTTLNNVDPFFKVLTAMRQKNPGASDAEHNSQLGSMIKAGEILAYSADPEKLNSYADFMTKMAQVHGSALRGEEVLNFAKSGKSAASGVSFEYLKSIFPTMLPELGGDRLGTASMTLRQALVGGKMKKRAAENLAALDIIDPKNMIKTDDDDVKGVKPSAVKGSKLLERNPLEWVRQILIPAMDKKGVASEDRPAMISTLFSDRNAEYLVNLLLTQGARLDKDRQTVDKALGLPGADLALKDDPYLAGKRVGGGLAGAGAALTGPFMEVLKSAADAAAGGLNAVAEAARGDKTSTAIGATGGGLLGAYLAAMASGGAGGLFRFAATGAGGAAGGAGAGLALPMMVAAFLKALESRGPEGSKQFYGSALPGFDGIYDRSRQAQRERNRDPEAARGRALMLLGADHPFSRGRLEVVRPEPVKAEVSGQVGVGVNVTVAPSPDFLTRIDQRVTSAVGNVVVNGNGGPGSTGRSMPEATAPSTGSASP